LINAYRSATADSIQNAEIIEEEDKDSFSIGFDYSVMNDVMKIIKEEQPEIIYQEFEMLCRIDLRIRRNRSEVLKTKFLKIKSVSVL
jgi:putative IMPACT (imprinted ancient) family translation regulator